MNLNNCLENLKKIVEKESMKKNKYFNIKKIVEKKVEKLDMSGRAYLRNKQQY